MYKNIKKTEKLQLKELVDYMPGQVISKTLVQNEKVSMTIFSFDKGEEISTHAAGGDAMVTVLEGTGKIHRRRRGVYFERGRNPHNAERHSPRCIRTGKIQDAACCVVLIKGRPQKQGGFSVGLDKFQGGLFV